MWLYWWGESQMLDFSLQSCWQGVRGGGVGGRSGNCFNKIRCRRKSWGASSRGAEGRGGTGPTTLEPVVLDVQAQLLLEMLSPLPNPGELFEGFI